MANEINYRHYATGRTLYGVVFNAAKAVWNGAYVTLVAGNWATYAISLAENPAGSYRYLMDIPDAALAAHNSVQVYEQAGGSPAITDTLVGLEGVSWTSGSNTGGGAGLGID
jgi:hypothetical protein